MKRAHLIIAALIVGVVVLPAVSGWLFYDWMTAHSGLPLWALILKEGGALVFVSLLGAALVLAAMLFPKPPSGSREGASRRHHLARPRR